MCIRDSLDNGTVSLDGLPEVHDAQRPLVNGRGSYALVSAALRRMDEVGFKYAVRTTVTRPGLSRVVESVESICRNFKAGIIQLEPMYAAGRAKRGGHLSPDPHEFARQFRMADEVARSYGRELQYSGARFGLVQPRFCRVSADLLALTPDGSASACFEVGDSADPRADLFFYGRLDPRSGELQVDTDKLARLRTLNAGHKASCAACFCRWSCGGECAAKLALEGDPWDSSRSERCIINRELTLGQMRDFLEYGAPQASDPLGGPGA